MTEDRRLQDLTSLLRTKEEAEMAQFTLQLAALMAQRDHLAQRSREVVADVENQTAHHATGTAMQWQLYLAAQQKALQHQMDTLIAQQDARHAQLAQAIGRDLAVQSIAEHADRARKRKRDTTQADALDQLVLLSRTQDQSPPYR